MKAAVIGKERKSGILRKAHVLRMSKKSLNRHLAAVGEAKGLEDIRRELAAIGPGDELLKAREVAAILKCSRSSVYRWAWEGRLPYYMVFGTAFRIRRSDLTEVTKESLVSLEVE